MDKIKARITVKISKNKKEMFSAMLITRVKCVCGGGRRVKIGSNKTRTSKSLGMLALTKMHLACGKHFVLEEQ